MAERGGGDSIRLRLGGGLWKGVLRGWGDDHSRGITTRGVAIAMHLIDLVLFSLLMHLTGGPASPLFVYLVFATICGAIRWQGRGALLTGAAVLFAYIFVTLARTASGSSEPFHAGQFMVRCAHLIIVAGLTYFTIIGLTHH